MSKFKKLIFTLVPSVLLVAVFQNCSNEALLDNVQQSQELSSQDVATIEVAAFEGTDGRILEIPDHLLQQKTANKGFEWFFVDEDGNKVDLQNDTSSFDLSGLDESTFLGGHFIVKMPEQSSIRELAFVFRDSGYEVSPEDPTTILGIVIGEPVVGVPEPPRQPVIGVPKRPKPLRGDRPVIGTIEPPPHPVVGLPTPPNQPVVGVPVQTPDERPVVGLPTPPNQPVVGVPVHNPADPPVVGLPTPPNPPVVGVPRPNPIPVIGTRRPPKPLPAVGVPMPPNPIAPAAEVR